MIGLVNLTLEYPGRILFENLNWRLNKRDRVALIGPNGAGKSTILKIVVGLEKPSAGTVAVDRNTEIGYLPQEGLTGSNLTVLDEVVSVHTEIQQLQKRLEIIEQSLDTLNPESPETMEAIDELGHLHHRLNDLDAHSLEARASTILAGLGFGPGTLERKCSTFSGGWQMRIALAKLLLMNPEALLLDEPSNHLDVESIEWLEGYLRTYEGALLVVSHDRYFINRVCNRITELSRRSLVDYFGTYEEFEEQKAEQEEQVVNAYERQQDEIRRIQLFVDRFRYKATKARQAQSRLKFLDRMDRIEIPAEEKRAINFRFPQPARSGRIVAEVNELSKSYGTKSVLKNISFTIERGDKVALVGMNGSGKSTLARLLVGLEQPDHGSIRLGHNVNLEYFAQQQAERFDPGITVYTAVEQAATTQPPLILRTVLGAFHFSGDDVYKRVGVLSGGEKARLALARMLLHPANFLLLDEPTNHIDASSKDVLLGALREYEGTVIVVSHDRYFLNELANKIIWLDQGSATVFPGDYDTYYERKTGKAPATSSSPAEPQTKADKAQRRLEREAAKKTQQEERRRSKKISELEAAITSLELQKSQIEEEMAKPEVYTDGEQIRRLQREADEVSKKIDAAFKEWTSLSEPN